MTTTTTLKRVTKKMNARSLILLFVNVDEFYLKLLKTPNSKEKGKFVAVCSHPPL